MKITPESMKAVEAKRTEPVEMKADATLEEPITKADEARSPEEVTREKEGKEPSGSEKEERPGPERKRPANADPNRRPKKRPKEGAPAEGAQPPKKRPKKDARPPKDEGPKQAKRKTPWWRIPLFTVLVLAGLALFTIGIKGVLSNMRVQNIPTTPMTHYDPSYQAALDAPLDKFDEVDAARKGEAEDTTDIVAEADTNTDVQALQERVTFLESEVENARHEAEEARNNEAFVRQEFENAKVLLDASTTREAQLQSELERLQGGGEGK